MSEMSRGVSVDPRVVAGIYFALAIILMVFSVVLSIIYDNSTYRPEWMPDAAKTMIELVKVVVGAIIGVFTPSAVSKLRG